MTTSPQARPLVIGIVGWKNSGKTTLVSRLIEEFTSRGLKVASVKHAHHTFEIDDKETDSARHRKAGAKQVAIVSAKRWAVVTQNEEDAEPSLDEVIASLNPSDIIIVEGYKAAPIPKIEARRTDQAKSTPLADADPNIIAIAADHAVAGQVNCPVFHLDNITEIADYLDTSIGPLQPDTRTSKPTGTKLER